MKKLNLMSQVKLTGAIILLACLFCLAGAANATVIYNNLYSPSDGVDSLTVYGPPPAYGPPLFNSFSTGVNDFYLLDVQLLLKRDTVAHGSFTVDIYSDNNNKPNLGTPPLFQIGNQSDTVLTSTLSVVEFFLDSPCHLAANTRYWLVLTSTDGSAAEWSWSADQTALGVAGEYFGQDGDDYIYPNYDSGPYQMRLSDIPLPPSLLLFGSGLAGLGLLRLRKLFQA
jgi:hypothetical protein